MAASSSSVSSHVTFGSVLPHSSLNAFSDAFGRTLLLRGLNVSGDAKYPVQNPLAGTPGFYDVANISYVGKPFQTPEQAEEWWWKLRGWGVGVVRLVVVWEALEPREMGVYDEDYISYVHMLVHKANEAGLRVFIDGHQDCVCSPKLEGQDFSNAKSEVVTVYRWFWCAAVDIPSRRSRSYKVPCDMRGVARWAEDQQPVVNTVRKAVAHQLLQIRCCDDVYAVFCRRGVCT
jgi:hypothetical protein